MAEPLPPGVRESSLGLIDFLTQRRVRGEPLGYGILSLNPEEQAYFEKVSKEARASGFYQRAENITKAQQRASQSGEGIASTSTGYYKKQQSSQETSSFSFGTKQYSAPIGPTRSGGVLPSQSLVSAPSVQSSFSDFTPKRNKFQRGLDFTEQFAGGVIEGGAYQIAGSPKRAVASLATFGIGTAVGGGLKLASYGARSAGTLIGGVKAGQIASTSVKVGGVAGGGFLTYLYGSEQYKKYKSAETTKQKGAVIGESIADFFLIGSGAKVGAKASAKGIGLWETRAGSGIPAESLIPRNVLSGEKRFPEIKRGSSAGELKSRFFELKLPGEKPGTPRAFTATDITPPKNEIIPRLSSEFAGKSASPDVSPNFLRVGGSSSGQKRKPFDMLKGFLGFDGLGDQPTITRYSLSGIGYAPGVKPYSRNLGGKPGIRRLQPFFEGLAPQKPRKGFGYIAFVKPETELKITQGSEFKLDFSRARFFTKIEGIRVPIYEKSPISKGEFFTGDGKKPSRFSQPFGSTESTPYKPSKFTSLQFGSSTYVRSKTSSPMSIISSSPMKSISSILSVPKSKPSSPIYPTRPSYRPPYSPPRSPPRNPPYSPPSSPPYSPILSYPNYKPPRFPTFTIPGLSGVKERSSSVRGTRKFRRTISPGAYLLGLKAKKASKFEITGLAERPILSSPRRRKK